MAFDIDDPETESLVLRLAALTGLSVDDAIAFAVRNQLARDRAVSAEESVSVSAREEIPARLPLDPAAS